MPVRYPRAQAARVLGPSGAANVVARPFAATRLAMTRFPVRAAPITAPGARLRNPGVAGYGDMIDLIAPGQALKEPSVWGPALGGVAIGVGSRIANVTGKTRNVMGLASLAAFGIAALNYYKQYSAIAHERKTVGAAAAPRTGEFIEAFEAKPPAGMTDSEKRVVLTAFACYENARRTDTWWGRMRGTARDPLKDCGLNAAQATKLKAQFAAIPHAERRLVAAFAPGGSLADLG